MLVDERPEIHLSYTPVLLYPPIQIANSNHVQNSSESPSPAQLNSNND